MQFLVIAHDGDDAAALDRRMKVREAHLEGARRMAAEGTMIEGGAILGDGGRMVGSVALVEFPSRQALDRWLAADPYVTGDVWRRIEITPIRLAPLRPVVPGPM
jgi:uncharacterized protein